MSSNNLEQPQGNYGTSIDWNLSKGQVYHQFLHYLFCTK